MKMLCGYQLTANMEQMVSLFMCPFYSRCLSGSILERNEEEKIELMRLEKEQVSVLTDMRIDETKS